MTTEIYHKICHYLRRLIAGTRWEGHVYTVGGCLRDRQLGLEIKDVDLAVDLPGGGVEFATWLWKKRLTCFRPVIFKRYGTAMTRLRAFPHDDIEIVQTRAEKYTDRNSRNPETAFGSLKDDCYRRDLTINSLYYNISEDRTLDVTGRAIHDLKTHHIDTPTDPDATFDDDPVRILRTIRFATRLDWQISPRIMEAMKRNSHRLDIIKVERTRGELEKMLTGPRPGRALELMRISGALSLIMPEIEKLYTLPLTGEQGTVWEHTLRTLGSLKASDLPLRMAALLHDVGKIPAFTLSDTGEVKYPRHELRAQPLVVAILNRMKYPAAFIKEVAFLCRHHTVARSWGVDGEKIPDQDLRKLQYHSASPSRLKALITLIDAINHAHSRALAKPAQAEAILKRDAQLSEMGTAMYDYHLPFGERHIKRIKRYSPGPQVADCITFMMQLAFRNPRLSTSEFEKLLLPFSPKHVPSEHKDYPTAVQPIPDALKPLPGFRRGPSREFGTTEKPADKPRRARGETGKNVNSAKSRARKQSQAAASVSDTPPAQTQQPRTGSRRRHHRRRRRR